jgi:hypothetical protein
MSFLSAALAISPPLLRTRMTAGYTVVKKHRLEHAQSSTEI